MNDLAITTDEPSVIHQIWTRLEKEPQVASNLTVERLHLLQEFRHLRSNVISAAVTKLRKLGVIEKIDAVDGSFVYGPGPAWNEPQSFRTRRLGVKIERKPGYKVARGDKPDFKLSRQERLDLGPNFARDEAREKQLRIARALPIDVIEQVLAEKRADIARKAAKVTS